MPNVKALVAAGQRCIAALAANGAPNCEAVKEMRAAIAGGKLSDQELRHIAGAWAQQKKGGQQ